MSERFGAPCTSEPIGPFECFKALVMDTKMACADAQAMMIRGFASTTYLASSPSPLDFFRPRRLSIRTTKKIPPIERARSPHARKPIFTATPAFIDVPKAVNNPVISTSSTQHGKNQTTGQHRTDLSCDVGSNGERKKEVLPVGLVADLLDDP